MTIGALAAHLVRAVTAVEVGLDSQVRQAEDPVSAAAYFARITNDTSSPLNVGVRARAAEIAGGGHRHCVDLLDRAVDHLRVRLHEAPEDRLVAVADGYVLRLDEYLATRIVELVVHTDDLCVSLGVDTPTLPALDVAIATLVEVAAFRHGELAVVRALARRERDQEEALRVL